MLFRVDILNIMGPAIVVAGLVWGAPRRSRAAVATGAVATAIAMVTPVVRVADWVDALPIWIQWAFPSVGRPYDLHAVSLGRVCLRRARPAARCSTADAPSTSGGPPADLCRRRLALAGLLHRLAADHLPGVVLFWTSSPTYFAIRVGVMMLVLARCCPLSVAFAANLAVQAPVSGCLELLYLSIGYTSSSSTAMPPGPLHRRLPLWVPGPTSPSAG